MRFECPRCNHVMQQATPARQLVLEWVHANPGVTITQTALAREFEVTRAAVNHAIHYLASEGKLRINYEAEGSRPVSYEPATPERPR